MGYRIQLTAGKILYAALFTIVLPILLILWANKTDSILGLPAFHHPLPGIFLIVIGLTMMLSGIISLYLYGKGLPMNPYPPVNYVTQGIYRYLSHPIYTGASILTIGLSIYWGSAGGLWLVSPIFILGCVALVMGYEGKTLKKRFPDIHFRPVLSLPQISDIPPTWWNKLSVYILVLIPSLILYYAIFILGEPDRAISSYLPFEAKIPVIGFTAIFYILAYPLVILAPLFPDSQKNLRDFMVTGLVASAVGFFAMIILPLMTPSKALNSPNIWSKLVDFSGIRQVPYVAFPSFRVIWTWIAISVFCKRFPSLKLLWYSLAILISLSCITTGMNSFVDVAGGLAVYWFASQRKAIWQFIQRSAEFIANSWKEWDFGHVRMMNHGLYGGLATFTGIFMVGLLIGPEYLPAILLVAVTAMIVSALWAQFIEGSKKLLRPLGFYGGVLGVIIGCFLAKLFLHADFFLIWASFAVAAPWVQGIGRVRCLVQGCCHGSIAPPNIGIRFFHPRSRVTRLASLRGEYLHPTQVYSILSNFFYGIFLLKLWFTAVPLPLIIGLCFILNGLSRFVEESYRGEPQTPIIKGLRLYQWIALIGIFIGAVLTTLPYTVNRSGIHFNTGTLFIAFVGGLLAIFVTGVDFPLSNKRFSRLV